MSDLAEKTDQKTTGPAEGSSVRIGVFILKSAEVAAEAIDYHQLAVIAAQLPGVIMVRSFEAGTKLDPEKLAVEIHQSNLDTAVLASVHPGFFKPAFSRAFALVGAGQVRLATFAEGGVSQENAKAAIERAVSGAPMPTAPATQVNPNYNPDTLVIGAGVAGIQAALEIAASGHKVYMVERTGTIGGRMAMFDKTFPTLDCAACILTPKMVAVGQNPNINLMVLSEIEEVSGEAGAFKIKVVKHPTRVDASICVACGDCAQFCPITTPSEFDMKIASHKVIHIPFPQAVPNTYMIDAAHCTWVNSDGKKCGVCAMKCSKGAVHLDAKEEHVEFEVGNIIVATGYDTFDASRISRYGYGTYPNVLTSLEFERLSNASGPTGGKIVMKNKRYNKRAKADEWVFEPDGPQPKAVAIVHCVGSRDINYNPYCSRVCCMYSLKFAHLVREKLPDAEVYEYYIDMRAYGKGYEEFHERIREEGVFLVRGRTASVKEQDSRLMIHGEDVTSRRLVDVPVDMVLLSVGLQPSAGADDLAGRLNITRDQYGWFKEQDYNSEPTFSGREGVYLAGVCQGPKDIPDTVAQASAAAASALRAIVRNTPPAQS